MKLMQTLLLLILLSLPNCCRKYDVTTAEEAHKLAEQTYVYLEQYGTAPQSVLDVIRENLERVREDINRIKNGKQKHN